MTEDQTQDSPTHEQGVMQDHYNVIIVFELKWLEIFKRNT